MHCLASKNLALEKSSETLMDEMQPVVIENKGSDSLEKSKFSHFAPIMVKNASRTRNASQYDIHE